MRYNSNLIKYNPNDYNNDKIIQLLFDFKILRNNRICVGNIKNHNIKHNIKVNIRSNNIL